MNLTRWEPFREMEEMFRSFPRAFGRVTRLISGDVGDWTPTADISETDKEYLIKAELPEVKKEDVRVTVDENIITISGERKQEKEQQGEHDIRVERFYGTFSRSFALPEDVDPQGIRAECKEGVLRVHIPKTNEKKSKAIEVQVQ